MTDITIPKEALEAARRAYELNVRFLDRDPLSAACLAMLRNWPGMSDIPSCEADGTRYPRVIHLPINTENTNDQP